VLDRRMRARTLGNVRERFIPVIIVPERGRPRPCVQIEEVYLVVTFSMPGERR
jgi:hypothetical protein